MLWGGSEKEMLKKRKKKVKNKIKARLHIRFPHAFCEFRDIWRADLGLVHQDMSKLTAMRKILTETWCGNSALRRENRGRGFEDDKSRDRVEKKGFVKEKNREQLIEPHSAPSYTSKALSRQAIFCVFCKLFSLSLKSYERAFLWCYRASRAQNGIMKYVCVCVFAQFLKCKRSHKQTNKQSGKLLLLFFSDKLSS